MAYVLGIDFGTSSSAAVIVKDGTPMMVPVDGNMYVLPSSVYIRQNGEWLVGEAAKQKNILHPTAGDNEIKRRVIHGDSTVLLNKKEYPLHVPLAKIFGRLKAAAENFVGEDITEAVVVLPKRLGETGRRTVFEAGSAAGFNNVASLADGTATLLAFTATHQNYDGRVLALDFGGGTMGATVGVIHGGKLMKIENMCEYFFGGVDFDAKIVDWVAENFKNVYHGGAHGKTKMLQRLYEAAETAKIELSVAKSTQIYLPRFFDNGAESIDLKLSLTRRQMDSLLLGYWEHITDMLKGMNIAPNVDAIILTGGLAAMPAAQNLVVKVFGKAGHCAMREKLQAFGAAMYGQERGKKAPTRAKAERIPMPGAATKATTTAALNNQSHYRVLVTATMSAGKSTFINALTGANVSRAQNLACTDRIISVVGKPTPGESNIAAPNTVNVYYEGMLSGADLCLLDSPGVNSSMDKEHRLITERTVAKGDYDLLIYLMNATQLATNDDSFYMEFVKEHSSGKPIMFVLNKIDCINPDEEDALGLINKAEQYIKSKGFADPMICPLSAKVGYMAKRARHNKFSRADERQMLYWADDLAKMDLANYYRQKFGYAESVCEDNSNENLLELSGLNFAERMIMKFYSTNKP